MATTRKTSLETGSKMLFDKQMNKIAAGIRRAAKRYQVPEHAVTATQFWSQMGDNTVTEWYIRKLGGFRAVREFNFPIPSLSTEFRLEKSAISASVSRDRVPPKAPKQPKPLLLDNFVVHESVSVETLFRQANLTSDSVFKVVVQPDTHVPEHDETALSAFLQFCRDYKPHGYINLGDFVEMDAVNKWPPMSAAPRRLVPELSAARDVLSRIDHALGKQCQYRRFIVGNHEDWLARYLISRVPELYDKLELLNVQLTIDKLLDLCKFGFQVVPFNEVLRLGDLYFLHGYYTCKYHAAKHLDIFGANIMYGHVHDVQSYSGISLKGLHEAVSIGCLRKLQAPFLRGRPNNWMHAFGVVEFRHDGTYTRYIPIIIDGRFSFGGKLYDGRKKFNK